MNICGFVLSRQKLHITVADKDPKQAAVLTTTHKGDAVGGGGGVESTKQTHTN